MVRDINYNMIIRQCCWTNNYNSTRRRRTSTRWVRAVCAIIVVMCHSDWTWLNNNHNEMCTWCALEYYLLLASCIHCARVRFTDQRPAARAMQMINNILGVEWGYAFILFCCSGFTLWVTTSKVDVCVIQIFNTKQMDCPFVFVWTV